MCPRPNVKICFACEKTNPSDDREKECKPRCKLCGGSLPTGTGNCANKFKTFKTPFLLCKRKRERRTATEKAGKSGQSKPRSGTQWNASASTTATLALSDATAMPPPPPPPQGTDKTPRRKKARRSSVNESDKEEDLNIDNAQTKPDPSRVCTFVRKDLTLIKLDRFLDCDTSLELCAVEVVIGRKKQEYVFLVNAYSNPQHRGQRFKTLFHKARRKAVDAPVLVAGDFNSPHKELATLTRLPRDEDGFRALLRPATAVAHRHLDH
ncbi:hypothetical protein HPB51_019883 [Rhipicephalus microplus]|uniref:Endonuclease/exonuclease/phosphatase domain-containing protein n=1 Tax=Rhipicephalus microplus TaxID=6941 RepID=A0A9J6D6K2_RHIMP|nr:hypothetical protein HPB51_019883 [Rhipicephalus microplus]